MNFDESYWVSRAASLTDGLDDVDSSIAMELSDVEAARRMCNEIFRKKRDNDGVRFMSGTKKMSRFRKLRKSPVFEPSTQKKSATHTLKKRGRTKSSRSRGKISHRVEAVPSVDHLRSTLPEEYFHEYSAMRSGGRASAAFITNIEDLPSTGRARESGKVGSLKGLVTSVTVPVDPDFPQYI